MGMFDRFYFKKGFLPNNKAPEGEEFQTKSLTCDLDTYEVDEHGNVIKYQYWDGHRIVDTDPINCIATIYSIEFIYDTKDLLTSKYLGTKNQEYDIAIKDSKVVYIKKTHESGYESE